MASIENLILQVKRNCNISDAKYWGTYSICGLLLRLRKLYRIENNIMPWERSDRADIGRWIEERERMWQKLEVNDFEKLLIGDSEYQPFDVENINRAIKKQGLVYSAGYGRFMKPLFFIADLLCSKSIEGLDIYIAGREYARDLSDSPSMLLEKSIFARLDAMRNLLWEKFEELKMRGAKGVLSFSFSEYGVNSMEELSEHVYNHISFIAQAELDAYIYHEIGEAFAGRAIGKDWKEMIANIGSPKAELFVRAVKDVMSDTIEQGMLKHIIDTQKAGSLGFYIAFLGDYRRLVFNDITIAFDEFIKSKDWNIIEKARKSGYKKAMGYAEALLNLYRKTSDNTEMAGYIEREILAKLKYT